MTVAHCTFSEFLNDDAALGSYFKGESWRGWKIIGKAIYGERLTKAETAFFKSVAGDREPPRKRVREVWLIVGRRGGKDSFASALACYHSAGIDYSAILRPGEKVSILCLACDKLQGRIILNYTKGYFHRQPMLASLVANDVAEGLDLSTGCEVRVFRNDITATRGVATSLCVLDECAFYADADSASASAAEVYASVIPSLATADGMLIGISTPYRKSGLLYEKYTRHFGKNDPDVLVIQAPSLTLNPTLDRGFIEEQIEADPEAANSEWNAIFRSDIGSLVDPAVVRSLLMHGRYELAPMPGVRYTAFCDPSGGSADSFTLCICHREKDVAVVDLLREIRPPFSPEVTVQEYSDILKAYRVHTVCGDKYAGLWPAEQFAKRQIRYEASDRTASELYLEMLSILNSGRVELLDSRRCTAQLIGLERRTSRLGKDTVSHAPGGHDDVANSLAGACFRALSGPQPLRIDPSVIEQCRQGRGSRYGQAYGSKVVSIGSRYAPTNWKGS